MNINNQYDVAIVGGGLAGLSLSILLAREEYRVCLFEKEVYPFHKVCGEYISNESYDFLTQLGLPLRAWDLPEIHRLCLTSPDGKAIDAELRMGGFGISRFKLDAGLAEIAKTEGVDVFEDTKVHQVSFDGEMHLIETPAGLFKARVACACFGKKSNLDSKWKRRFTGENEKQNYVGVKYHVYADLPADLISLHNFPGGYCGISKIEEGKYCLCYLTKSDNLKANRLSIPDMEENILKQNPALRKVLEEVDTIYKEPLTIARISFSKKTQVENHVLCIGDAAGMITPLCGNGMSMALHGSKLAAACIHDYLHERISRAEMENRYQKNWNRQFGTRLRTGRMIQRFFGSSFRTNMLLRMLKPFPFLIQTLIRATHGKEF